MKSILDLPSIPLDPNQMVVRLKLTDAQVLAKHIGKEGFDDVIELMGPLAEAIRLAITEGQRRAIELIGKEAVQKSEAAAIKAKQVEAERLAKELEAAVAPTEAGQPPPTPDAATKLEAVPGRKVPILPPNTKHTKRAVNGSATTKA